MAIKTPLKWTEHVVAAAAVVAAASAAFVALSHYDQCPTRTTLAAEKHEGWWRDSQPDHHPDRRLVFVSHQAAAAWTAAGSRRHLSEETGEMGGKHRRSLLTGLPLHHCYFISANSYKEGRPNR